MPILEWTLQDELDFISMRGIKLHPLYYNDDGSLDLTRRLGCMCCPLASINKRREEFLNHPRMLRQYIRNMIAYYESHPNTGTVDKFGDAYSQMVRALYFDKQEDFEKFRQTDIFGERHDGEFCKAILERNFGVDLSFNN